MTDGRFSSLHMTDGALLALDLAEATQPDAFGPGGFGSIPAFDDNVPVPPQRDPRKPDEDETLPSKAHPSYPYGRPYALNRTTDLGGHPSSLSLAHNLFALSAQTRGSGGRSIGWPELGLRDLLPAEVRREIPPGMAGAKRGPEDDRESDDDDDDGANEGAGTEMALGDEGSTDAGGSLAGGELNGGSRLGSEDVERMDDDDGFDEDDYEQEFVEGGDDGRARSLDDDDDDDDGEAEDSMAWRRTAAQPLARAGDWQRRPAEDP